MNEGLVQFPIFPLPESILFPGIYVPFHIFEERYKAMLKQVEESAHSMMAISYAPEMQPGRFFPCMVCGVGAVKILRKYENGEADIIVLGAKRVKFQRYVQEIPFLVGEGQVLELERDMPTQTETQLLKDLKEMLINWIFANFSDSNRPIQFFKTVADLEPICNFVAYYFVNDIEKKQSLLEENNLESKAQRVWQILKDIDDSDGPGPQGPPLIFPGSGPIGGSRGSGGSGPTNIN